jgi:Mg-chelatase subunit ChlD
MSKEFLIPGVPEAPRVFHQLGILVLDGSPSMSSQSARGKISKADAVNVGVRELLTRLAASKNRKNFSIAVIAFSDSSVIQLPSTPVERIDDNASYNPLLPGGSGTHIGTALSEARRVADEFFRTNRDSGVPSSVVVVLMSDGANTGGLDPITEAASLKSQSDVTLCATLFSGVGGDVGETEEAKNLLMQIATSPAHYKTVYDTETLRKFFIASVSSVRNVRMDV